MERIRVIIADDESLIRMDLREMLTDLGYLVVGEVGDGFSAVNLAREMLPDIVVMDIKMPDMDGIDAAKMLTEEHIAPVLIVSAYSQADLVQRARKAGVAGYLVKPFRKSDLAPAIDVALARFSEFRIMEREVNSLQDALDTRKAVDRAKGILMDTQGLNETEAFRKIQKMSINSRKPMRSVAEAIILAHRVSETDVEQKIVESKGDRLASGRSDTDVSTSGVDDATQKKADSPDLHTDDTALLVGALVHRLSNILGPLRPLVKIAGQNYTGDSEYFDLIDAAVSDALGILRRLGMLSLSIEAQPVDVTRLVDAALKEVVISENIELHVEWQEQDNTTVLANPQFLTEILINLVINAIQAMPSGGNLWITGEIAPDKCLELRIKDSGQGIPSDVQMRLFEPFFTTRKSLGGQGIGLWLSRTLAEKQGGVLQLEESKSNEGSVFLLRLRTLEG